MSTFGGLNTAYRGLTAAQQAINLAGQNIANSATPGYTRQRIEQSAIGAPGRTGVHPGGAQAGQGVSVDGIARLGNTFLDAGVRNTAAASGYATVRSTEMQRLEDSLQEPGEHGISTALHSFWASWQGVANHPGESAPASVLLEAAATLSETVSAGYGALDAQWSRVRGEAAASVNELNAAAGRVANLNAQIRSTLAAGGSANELIDARSQITESIAALSGGSVRVNADGTADVFIGGNALVSGTSVRPLTLAGPTSLSTATTPVQLEWADRPGTAVNLDGGELAGAVSLLAPANGSGTGGVIAQTADAYNAFATQLMSDVNATHRTGQSSNGATGLDFFASTAGLPAAMSIRVVPTNAAGIATGAVGSGALDGSVADRLSQIGSAASSPDVFWSGVVSAIGMASRAAQQHSQLADAAGVSAVVHRNSGSGVSLDEENISLLAGQHAYQAAARVMTAIDEALDVLINRTGLVGR
ncbi:flagellar hook-associated protein FlgK [Paenarthrobacter ureafaciens]|uniref:flagellar hook-associated protein FlgK n=1 Tax=Paenarthrobacter ureafaciens TaxID=37931 RepID=UPI001408E42E|nr:flagellar hook-associated protein FlgK [Paenarthrobacter ureafaciens]MCX8454276.1 flagellar hook-associated protein FlgK [Paenarthrobacter ureafaciens]MCY0972482.1 flagellar hook-associated protein FlgK [Paenarthrobacter ureafaciens]